MTAVSQMTELIYKQRLDALHETKLQQTKEKQQILGPMDYDDWGIILPPIESREVTKAMSGSGIEITDVLLKGVPIESNHPSGGWYGPEICGKNYRSLLELHPVYIDPMSSLAGAYMVNFLSYRKHDWPEEMRYPRDKEHARYGTRTGVGGMHHFCQDLAIGLELGWGGLLNKIHFCRDLHAPAHAGFYAGLEHVVLGVQNWVQRTSEAAYAMAQSERNPQLRRNLEEMAEINRHVVCEPPRTFREACQWIAWFQMMARMYNGNGSIGRLDVLLRPYYERDVAKGILNDEEAIFHIACLYLKETGYIQLGGPDAEGNDATNPVSFICLEAVNRIKVPVNLGVSVGPKADRRLLRRGVEILFEDKAGTPKFIGTENVVQGFARDNIPMEVARLRAFAGCAHFALPGREYCLASGSNVNLVTLFAMTFNEMMNDASATPSVDWLWQHFASNLEYAIELVADGFDFHMKHMHLVFPELAVDLCCHGPIQKGLDASQPGGLEYANAAVDATGLATVADSFAAVEQRVEQEQCLTWQELKHLLDTDWGGTGGEQARLMMKMIHRFGYGNSRADEWAQKIAHTFSTIVRAKSTPEGHNMIPGIYGWMSFMNAGRHLGATPNGRHAQAPISHGGNPDSGFRRDGAPTALSAAIASVEMGWGNTVPMQLDLDPSIVRDEEGIDNVMDLIQGHMDKGGTLINLNILDKQQILAADKNPELYPDLIVRVTGFSAYWSSLSKELRELIVERIISEGD